MKLACFLFAAAGVLGVLSVIGCSQSGKLQSPHPTVSPYWQNGQTQEAPLENNEEEREILPVTHFVTGQLREKQKQYQAAVSQYSKAIKLNPEFVAAYNRVGICLDKLRHHREAEQAFQAAIRICPNSSYLHNNLGFNLIMQKNYSRAESELRMAVQLRPGYQRAQVNLGIALAKLEKYEEALVQFQEVLGEPQAHYNLGLIYSSQRKYAQAVEAFEKSISLEPRLTYARLHLNNLKPLVSNAEQKKELLAGFSNLDEDQQVVEEVAEYLKDQPAAEDKPTIELLPEHSVAEATGQPQTEIPVTLHQEIAPVDAPSPQKVVVAEPVTEELGELILQEEAEADDLQVVLLEQEPCDYHIMDSAVADVQLQMLSCYSGDYEEVYLFGGSSLLAEEIMQDVETPTGFAIPSEVVSDGVNRYANDEVPLEQQRRILRSWQGYPAVVKIWESESPAQVDDSSLAQIELGQDLASLINDLGHVVLEELQQKRPALYEALSEDWEVVRFQSQQDWPD